MEFNSITIIEAGPGTGKSYTAAFNALNRAIISNTSTIISTSTISLVDQIDDEVEVL